MVVHPKKSSRSAIAVVEFAVCVPLLVTLVAGLLEVGRMVEVVQIMTNAVREASRSAATGLLPIPSIKISVGTTAFSFSSATWPGGTAFVPPWTVPPTNASPPYSSSTAGLGNSPSIAYQMLAYLQAQQYQTIGNAFGSGHATSISTTAPSGVTYPSGYTCYTVTDTTTSNEIFTILFYDVTQPAVTDTYALYSGFGVQLNANSQPVFDHFKLGIQIPYSLVSISPLPQITGTPGRLSVTLDWLAMVDPPVQLQQGLPGY